MDREVLRSYLSQGRSLEQIGALTERHASTVGYWIRRHGLAANGRARYSRRGGSPESSSSPSSRMA